MIHAPSPHESDGPADPGGPDAATAAADPAARRRRRWLRGGFVALLILPAVQMVLPVVKDPKLEGVESPLAPLSWSVAAWSDGSLAAALDVRVRRAIGFRPVSVRLVNQARLAWHDPRCTLDNGEVFIGKQNWLFGRPYLDPYTNPARRLTDEDLRGFVRELRSLQDRLADRGTTFVLAISPSKCELYPEYLPDDVVEVRRRNDCRRDYDAFVELLAEEGVRVVDGPAIFRRLKSTHGEHLFSRTGVHWSYHGCLLFWRELLAVVNAASGLGIPIPEIVAVERDRARHADHDLGKMVNAFVPPGGRPVMGYPVVRVDPLPPEQRPGFLFVGSSFCWTLMDALYVSGSGRDVDLFYYNRTHYRGPDGAAPLEPGARFPRHRVCSLEAEAPDWRRALLEKDVVVLEMLEFMLPQKGWGFCGPALGALEQLADVPARRPPLARIAGGRDDASSVR
jgi:hypothetical protein